ncbi:hypothetical protein [Caulobacter sp. 17J65-9]|uniref:hypothetical protein n=1 Tax=Caulobacter sp. 17J65-9 TaxID=2709382 RepID=UPI0013C5CB67|nr:hypothetical protein [Caulobacter sp. 17J65-9]NEX93679.1 hypothetical protein [Caulobacter sp. 17J65-9]
MKALFFTAALAFAAAAGPAAAAWDSAGPGVLSAASKLGEQFTLERTAAGYRLTLKLPQLSEGMLNDVAPVVVVNPVDTDPDRYGVMSFDMAYLQLEAKEAGLGRDCAPLFGEEYTACVRDGLDVQGDTLVMNLPAADQAVGVKRFFAALDRAKLVKVSYVIAEGQKEAVFLVGGGARPTTVLLPQ